MKNQTINKAKISMKSIFTPAAFALMLLASSVPATIYAEEKKPVKIAAAPVEVKYLGQVDNQPIFEMNIDNKLEDNLYVTLRDEDGDILYGETFTSKRISKKFQFVSAGYSDLNVTINLSSKNSKTTQVYQISNVSKLVEDVVVTKVE